MVTNKRHLAFIDALFLNNFNGTVAYKKVYKCKGDDTAAVNASKLLSNTKIKEAIEIRQKDLIVKSTITRESLVKDLTEIKNAQKELFPSASIKAIEVIAKMLGLNEPEKHEISGGMDIKLTIDGLPPDLEEKEEDLDGE